MVRSTRFVKNYLGDPLGGSGHFMTSEVVEMFLFYSVGVLTLQRLPCNFLEPSTALNIESLSGPIQRVAFPLLQTQYIY